MSPFPPLSLARVDSARPGRIGAPSTTSTCRILLIATGRKIPLNASSNKTGPSAMIVERPSQLSCRILRKKKREQLSTPGYRTERVHTRVAVMALVLAALHMFGLGCYTNSSDYRSLKPSDLEPTSGLDEETTFIVDAPGGHPLSDVEVIAVTGDGLQRIGQTNAEGLLTTPVNKLQGLAPYAVLFCHPTFPCGAIVVNELFFGYREHNVELARAVVY